MPLDLLPGWLFNISPSRVKTEYRERVQRYRDLCYRALWRAFQRGELFPVKEPTSVEASASTITGSHDLRVIALSEQIETLSAIVELMQEHKAALLAEGSAMVAVAANQQELTAAMQAPPADVGLWSGPKVAQWMQQRLGRPVAPQRGWE